MTNVSSQPDPVRTLLIFGLSFVENSRKLILVFKILPLHHSSEAQKRSFPMDEITKSMASLALLDIVLQNMCNIWNIAIFQRWQYIVFMICRNLSLVWLSLVRVTCTTDSAYFLTRDMERGARSHRQSVHRSTELTCTEAH